MGFPPSPGIICFGEHSPGFTGIEPKGGIGIEFDAWQCNLVDGVFSSLQPFSTIGEGELHEVLREEGTDVASLVVVLGVFAYVVGEAVDHVLGDGQHHVPLPLDGLPLYVGDQIIFPGELGIEKATIGEVVPEFGRTEGEGGNIRGTKRGFRRGIDSIFDPPATDGEVVLHRVKVDRRGNPGGCGGGRGGGSRGRGNR